LSPHFWQKLFLALGLSRFLGAKTVKNATEVINSGKMGK